MTLDPLDLVEERLRQTVDKVQRRDRTITAQCPAHADRNPSLSVSVGDRRDIILHCHAGCQPEEIMRSLDLRWRDFATEQSTDTAIAYVYSDEAGMPLYRVLRQPGKQFRQQRMDPSTGEWVWGLGDTRRVLYRLPQVLEAKQKGLPIWIAEGEKDVDRLVLAGVKATCNSGGAGKFTAEHADVLAGCDIVIVADRDDTGTAHATAVRDLLTARGCTVQIVVAAHGKDAFDHLAAGKRLEEFLPFGEERSIDELDENLRLVDWPSFWAGDHLTEEWAIYPLVPAKRTISLYAPAKAGKSTVVLAMVAAAVAGKPILGMTPHPEMKRPKVLYLDYEMTDSDLFERLSELGYSPDDAQALSGLHYALLPNIDTLDSERGAQQVLEAAQRYTVDLVVIDTFGRAVAGEENDADTVRTFYRLTAKQLKAAGIAVLRTDHAGKNLEKGQRGSSAKNDDVDVVWRLQRTDAGVQLNRTHSRVGWVPEQIDIVKTEHDDGRITYELGRQRSFPDGTADVAALLDELGLPVDVSGRKAITALREAGHKARNDRVRAAVQMRRQRIEDPFLAVDNSGRGTGARPVESDRGAVVGRAELTPVDQASDLPECNGARSGARWGALELSNRGAPRFFRSGRTSGPESEEPIDEMF